MYFRIEYQLFDTPFSSKFQVPRANMGQVRKCINENINYIMKNLFNPIVDTGNTTFSATHQRVNPEFNKFYAKFSSEKISPFACPLETIFLVLSKIHWNSKLKLAKSQKIALTCLDLSKEESISYFDTEGDLKDLHQQQKRRNLESLTELFKEFFQMMAALQN